MGKETSQRIQTSLLNAAEKRILIWLAQRQPSWVTSDMLTFLGVGGAVICALGFLLSCWNIQWLWLSSLGLVINWYGDSLDGTLARVRNTQRPVYGFFIDHTLDAITICIMCIGAGLSPMLRLDIAMLILAGYLCLSIYTYIGAILKGEFRLTYSSFGPTEFRLLKTLMEVPGKVFSREYLLKTVWGDNVYVESRTVDVHIRRLRKSLNDFGPDYIRTVRATGYSIDRSLDNDEA